MFFEARDHVLKAFRETGVRETLLSKTQRSPDQYQSPGVWVYVLESTLERFNKKSREFEGLQKALLRGSTTVRVELVAASESELVSWVALGFKWLLEHPLKRADTVFDVLLTPVRFAWTDELGVLPSTTAVSFEIKFADALLEGIDTRIITPVSDEVFLDVV